MRVGSPRRRSRRAQHFFPGFRRVLGAGTRPSLGAGTGLGALWKGGEAAPSPTAGWDAAGEGLWVLIPDRPSQEGRVPGSGAAEAAGPLGAEGSVWARLAASPRLGCLRRAGGQRGARIGEESGPWLDR